MDITRIWRNSSARSVSDDAQRGYTLVELMIVTGIFAIVSSVVLGNYAKFGGTITLENLTYDVALSVRQTQVYGIAVQRYGASNFSASYGMHFASADSTGYQLFGDVVVANGLYDCPDPGVPSSCELLQASTFSGGYTISKLCAPAGEDAAACTGVSKLDILFKRPEPDALISVNDLSCSLSISNCEQSARIVVRSPRGDQKSVVVEATGQISVQ